MAALVLNGICKVYPGGVDALRDVDLHVADGEMIAVLGPSGSGKTTLLRVIAGLDEATSGTVSFNGRPADGSPPRDRNVAMVFQDAALYPHLTVRGNLAFGAATRGVARDEVERRVDQAAAVLGLTDLLGRLPRSLSGGEQRRVALGRAIVVEPACTLYDEPLGGLDATLLRRLRGELRTLHRRLRRTALYVTHDHEEALAIADRVLVLAGGRVRQVGTPQEVYRHPADRFVAEFVGDPPMNFIDGVVTGNGFAEPGGIRVRVGDSAPGRGGPAVLGVRPSALARSRGGVFQVQVDDVTVGYDHADVSGRTPGGAAITARLPVGEQPAPGETVELTASPDALHLFEPGEFGRAL